MLSRKPRKKIMNFRIDVDEKLQLEKAAKLNGLSPSTFLRKIVFEYLNNG